MLQDAAKVTKPTKRNLVVASTRHHRSRLLKYYPRPQCAPSFVKSRMLRPLQTHFLLFQQIFFVLVCIHPGTPRVPPRVLPCGPKPRGGKYSIREAWMKLYQNMDLRANIVTTPTRASNARGKWTFPELLARTVVHRCQLNEAEKKRQAKRLICGYLLVSSTFHCSSLILCAHGWLSAYHSVPVVYSVWKKKLPWSCRALLTFDWAQIAGKPF